MSKLSDFIGVKSTDDFKLTIITDNFTLQSLPNEFGSFAGGGYVICKSGTGSAILVSPRQTEVRRCWYCRYDAAITANNFSNGQYLTNPNAWFIPCSTVLRDVGYCCRKNWDNYLISIYWADDAFDGSSGTTVNFNTGQIGGVFKLCCNIPVRAFRCVSY